MHGSRACADPASQREKQAKSLTVHDRSQMASSRRMLGLSHRDGEETKRGKTERRKERHTTRGGKTGQSLPFIPLHKARHMAAACWITNSGNLESPPVKSSLAFPSSPRLSNTITYFTPLLLSISPLRASPQFSFPPLFVLPFVPPHPLPLS